MQTARLRIGRAFSSNNKASLRRWVGNRHSAAAPHHSPKAAHRIFFLISHGGGSVNQK